MVSAAFTPAFRLVVACVHWPPTPARTRAVAQAATHAALDWQEVHTLAVRNRIAGLVVHALATATVRPPESVQRALAAQAQRDAQGNLRLLNSALVLVRACADAGIVARVLKGPALVTHLYGSPMQRQCKDVDLLVDEDDVAGAARVCHGLGYVPQFPPPTCPERLIPLWLRWHKDLVFTHPSWGQLELHVRPAPCPLLSRRLDLPAGLGEVPLAPGVTLPTVLGETLYAYLCWHGACSRWRRLKWLADLAALTDPLDASTLETWHASARRRGVGRASGLALLLLQELFGRELPHGVREEVHGDRMLPALLRASLRVIVAPIPSHPSVWDRVTGLAYQLLMIEAWSSRWRDMQALFMDWPLLLRLPWLQRGAQWWLRRWPESRGGPPLVLASPLFMLAKIVRRCRRLMARPPGRAAAG